MLLSNLNPSTGRCNGSQILLTKIGHWILTGILTTGRHAGTPVAIPRTTVMYRNATLPFVLPRHAFPVKRAFAMTINKSQGQSLRRVGLLLSKPCFSHGQLYVAFSRCGYPPSGEDGVRVVVRDVQDQQGAFSGLPGIYTRNVVEKEALAVPR